VQVAYTITEVSLALAIAFEDTSSKADDIHVAMNNIVSILRQQMYCPLRSVLGHFARQRLRWYILASIL
jgi:hypothetical protein